MRSHHTHFFFLSLSLPLLTSSSITIHEGLLSFIDDLDIINIDMSTSDLSFIVASSLRLTTRLTRWKEGLIDVLLFTLTVLPSPVVFCYCHRERGVLEIWGARNHLRLHFVTNDSITTSNNYCAIFTRRLLLLSQEKRCSRDMGGMQSSPPSFRQQR